jgi:hypothetical protein
MLSDRGRLTSDTGDPLDTTVDVQRPAAVVRVGDPSVRSRCGTRARLREHDC